jgi:hypothetical protein
MIDPLKPPTHKAFAFLREGKKMRFGRWLEIGTGRTDPDGTVHVFMDRTPIGGFSGYVLMKPNGSEPPAVQPRPERPGDAATDEDSAADYSDA